MTPMPGSRHPTAGGPADSPAARDSSSTSIRMICMAYASFLLGHRPPNGALWRDLCDNAGNVSAARRRAARRRFGRRYRVNLNKIHFSGKIACVNLVKIPLAAIQQKVNHAMIHFSCGGFPVNHAMIHFAGLARQNPPLVHWSADSG